VRPYRGGACYDGAALSRRVLLKFTLHIYGFHTDLKYIAVHPLHDGSFTWHNLISAAGQWTLEPLSSRWSAVVTVMIVAVWLPLAESPQIWSAIYKAPVTKGDQIIITLLNRVEYTRLFMKKRKGINI
jgi:hypothetical protein